MEYSSLAVWKRLIASEPMSATPPGSSGEPGITRECGASAPLMPYTVNETK